METARQKKSLAARQRVAQDRGVELDPDGSWSERECPFCRDRFKPRHGSQIYCAEDCREWAGQQRRGVALKWLTLMTVQERKALRTRTSS